jgi:Uma2 family endonuclease
MATAPNTPLSVTEYLQLEEAAEFRSEYIDGQMVAMAGGTLNHALISSNLVGEFRNRLLVSDCKVFGSDMRIRTSPSGIYTYADAVVGCGRLEVVDNTLTNPVLIAEVLSDSTEAYDRGRKFGWYRQIGSLRDYILVDQKRTLIEHFRKEREGDWWMRDYGSLDAGVRIDSLEITIPASEIYRGVDLST